MNIAIHGPGRAGGALAIALSESGHTITSVTGRSRERADKLADRVGAVGGTPDLLIVAVSDDALASIHEMLHTTDAPAVVHVSGAVPVSVLEPFAANGAAVGSFHPLQTMPDAETGARRLSGASVAVTAEEPLSSLLFGVATSIGCRPFLLDDAVKPLYHAAAAATANATLAALAVARDLYAAAGIDFEHARPLVDAVVANAFDLGPGESLTGPIARGDVATVEAQVSAVRQNAPETLAAFTGLCLAIAEVAGRGDEFAEVLS
jgi:predicted short-subunit dehydrogenase-like oxidoreductase (DUF2520 family)